MLDKYRKWLDGMETSKKARKESKEQTERLAREYLSRITEYDRLKTSVLNTLATRFDIMGHVEESSMDSILREFTEVDDRFRSAILFSLGALSADRRLDVAASTKDAAWSLAGELMGEYIALSEPAESWSNIYHRKDHLPPLIYHDTFIKSFCRTLDKNSAEKLKWLDFLTHYAGNCHGDFINDMMSPRSFNDDQIAQLQTSWKANYNPWAIIENQQFSFHISTTYGYLPSFFKLFYCLDRRTWIQAVELLPIPQLIESVVTTAIHDSDDSSLLDLLRVAPTMFSEQHTWTRNCSVLLITREIASRLKSIHLELRQLSNRSFNTSLADEAKVLLDELEGAGAQEWLKAAYSTLLERPDGEEIALFLMKTDTLRLDFMDLTDATSEWDAERIATQVLASHLTKHQVSTESLLCRWLNQECAARTASSPTADDDWIGEGGRNLQTPGVQHLLVAARIWNLRYPSAEPLNPSRAEEAWWLWRWLETLLYGYDKQLPTLARYDGVDTSGTTVLAEVLAACSNPLKEWKTTFSHLDNQRYRLRTRQSSLHWTCKPSILLNSIALITLRIMLQGGARFSCDQTNFLDFMVQLFESSWFLYETEPAIISHSRAQLRLILTNCIIYFSLLGPVETLPNIAKMWELIRNDREIVSAIEESILNIIENSKGQRDAIIRSLRVVGIEYT